jgi:hypothetical protein
MINRPELGPLEFLLAYIIQPKIILTTIISQTRCIENRCHRMNDPGLSVEEA